MNVVASTADLDTFLSEFGLTNPQLQRIQAGRNSRVWRVVDGDERYIVKEYFRHPADLRDRLGTEFGFLSFLQSQGIAQVPKPLARQTDGDRALYSYLPGTPVPTINTEHIQQAAAFIAQINHSKFAPAAQQLPLASEACLSMAAHLECVKMRLTRLQTAVTDEGDAARSRVRQLLRESFWPTYQKIEHQIHTEFAEELTTSLHPEQQILSPSDFGFHNILLCDGQLYFLDFEYAGWDDPAKLLCDFQCQPERPITAAQGQAFQAYLAELAPFATAQHRAELLLPLYRLKWCCILLNEFRQHDRERRDHAGVSSADRLHQQLQKAEAYFTQHLQNYLCP